jgi:hypothetical protein
MSHSIDTYMLLPGKSPKKYYRHHLKIVETDSDGNHLMRSIQNQETFWVKKRDIVKI